MSDKLYGSDVMVDMLKKLDFEYIAFNPGATFRGIHESLLDQKKDNAPEIILCCHEEISVALAHGYFKASGRPLAVAIHNVVGLQHASMAIFNAWCDRVPIYVIGGTGPMDVSKRRPWIDWVHTALVQGNLVRDFVKWDDQPYSMEAVPESLLRGYKVMMTQPHGPVYICLDVEHQERELNEIPELLPAERFLSAELGEISSKVTEDISSALVEAEFPVIVADYLGREPGALESLVELAEVLAAPVIDQGRCMNFPNSHPLDASGMEEEVLARADAVLALETPDIFGALHKVNRSSRELKKMVSSDTKVFSVGFNELRLSSLAGDMQRINPSDISVVASGAAAAKKLADECQRKVGKTEERRNDRIQEYAKKHRQQRKEWQMQAKAEGEMVPISPKWLALQLWEAIKDKDWVLVNSRLKHWPRRLWKIDKSWQYLGGSGGAGLGYGIGASIGAALAYKDSGKLCVNIQGDGDFLFTPSALWTAAHYKAPLLTVMFNNRTYYNSEEHTGLVASYRNRSNAVAGVGNRLEDPTIDFAALARAQGVYAEGPIENPELLMKALVDAVKYVLEEGKPALVDVITGVR